MPSISPAEAIRHLRRRLGQSLLYQYRPLGHPDTLCPNGKMWADKHSKGEWSNWSNKPWQLNFHDAGRKFQERMLMTGNRSGKTTCASAEVAYHATGDYPAWWTGRRFDKPVLIWTGSPTNETSRDIQQKFLLGGISEEELGTGFIPRQAIVSIKMRQAGVANVVDTAKIRHISGDLSTIIYKTYEQGWMKWQGTEPEVVWFDEEPSETKQDQKDIYSEALTRLLTSHGLMMVTFTPLQGITELVESYQSGGDGVYLDGATWDDAPQLNDAEKERMKARYKSHEIDARTRGIPMMGAGGIFDIDESEIQVQPFEIPRYFARIKGVDFGIDHPCAVADIAYDRDNDIVYLTRVWKSRDATSEEHAERIINGEQWVPVSWPHDGTTREKGSGQELKDIYRAHGVKMLSMSARYSNDKGGSQRSEPIVLELQERIRDGRFKVFNFCHDFFQEYRNYHRDKDGKIVSKRDDILKALFYALMMKRYAMTRGGYRQDMPAPTGLRMAG